MSEDVKAVHREPHPFVGIQNLLGFVGKTVAFVGRVDRVEDGTLYMKAQDGKYLNAWELVDLNDYVYARNGHASSLLSYIESVSQECMKCCYI